MDLHIKGTYYLLEPAKQSVAAYQRKKRCALENFQTTFSVV
jgi:hypothetical protein